MTTDIMTFVIPAVKKGCIALAAVMIFAACTKEGDTIYQPDPSEPKANTAPFVPSSGRSPRVMWPLPRSS